MRGGYGESSLMAAVHSAARMWLVADRKTTTLRGVACDKMEP